VNNLQFIARLLCYSSTEIVFGDDAVYDYTLLDGDLVEFLIASDRRDRLQHAINIELLEETFHANHERREKVNLVDIFIPCSTLYDVIKRSVVEIKAGNRSLR